MTQLHMFDSFLVYIIYNNLPLSGDHFTGLTMVAEPNAFEEWLF